MSLNRRPSLMCSTRQRLNMSSFGETNSRRSNSRRMSELELDTNLGEIGFVAVRPFLLCPEKRNSGIVAVHDVIHTCVDLLYQSVGEEVRSIVSLKTGEGLYPTRDWSHAYSAGEHVTAQHEVAITIPKAVGRSMVVEIVIRSCDGHHTAVTQQARQCSNRYNCSACRHRSWHHFDAWRRHRLPKCL